MENLVRWAQGNRPIPAEASGAVRRRRNRGRSSPGIVRTTWRCATFASTSSRSHSAHTICHSRPRATSSRRPPFYLTATQREKILELAQDLPRLWHAETTRQSQRKEVLRLLIEDVTVTNVDEPWGVAVAIQWRTGTLSQRQAKRPLPHPQTTAAEVVARIEALYQTRTDAQIAELLNAEGYRSGYGKTFTAERVAHVRNRRGWRKYTTDLKEPAPPVH